MEVVLSVSYGCYSKVLLNSSGDVNTVMDENQLNYLYTGIDFKYKYSPDTYTALTIQGEALLDYRDAVREGSFGINRNIDTLNLLFFLCFLQL